MADTPRPPPQKGSFACVVWNIVGGRDSHPNKVAALLKLAPKDFKCFWDNTRRVSKHKVDHDKWREVLAAHYPDGWILNQTAFERGYRKLNEVGRSGALERPKKAGQGLILWLIIGAEKGHLKKTSDQLGTPYKEFNDIIHGNRHMSIERIKELRWDEKLPRIHPEGWAEHGAAFIKVSSAFHRRGPKEKPQGSSIWQGRSPDEQKTIEINWRLAVGALARAAQKNMPLDMDDVPPAIFDGAPSTSVAAFRTTLTHVILAGRSVGRDGEAYVIRANNLLDVKL